MSRRRPKAKHNPSSKRDRSESDPSTGDRLQKVLAAAGLGSRRDCEELISAGRVEIDRQTVTKLGTKVDPLVQDIRVDGVALPKPRRAYFVLNKPAGVVCTNDDPGGRMRAIDLIRSDERLFTIGRLDRSSEGMLLITNDGTLANQLTHPRYGVEKVYLVRIVGNPNPVIFEKLKRGIHLAEGVARVSDIRVRKGTSRFTDLEIVLQEGRNREIRRILARIGHKVVRLKRIAIGPLRLGELPEGASRPLTRDEVRKLRESAVRKPRGKGTSRNTASRNTVSRSTAVAGIAGDRGAGDPHGTAGAGPPTKQRTTGNKHTRRPPVPLDSADSEALDEAELLLDEVEVLETPEGLPEGLVIGDDSTWDPPATQRGSTQKKSATQRPRANRDRSPRDRTSRDRAARGKGATGGGATGGGTTGGGPRSGGPRSGGPRSGGPRSGGPRSGGPRGAGSRGGGPNRNRNRKNPGRANRGR